MNTMDIGLPSVLVYFFLGSGVVFIFFLFALFISWALGCIREKFKSIKNMYVYKHRFNKPPIAKCYCIDCEHYGANNKLFTANRDECLAHKGWNVADNWFCWNAEPCKKVSDSDE